MQLFLFSGLHHGEMSVPSTSMGIDVQYGYDEEKGSDIPNDLSELLSNNFDKNCYSNAEVMRRDANSSHRHGYAIQTPDLNEVFQPECHTGLSQPILFTSDEVLTPCLVENAQVSSTPSLLELVPSNSQEVPALSPQEKAETHAESSRPGNCCSPYMDVGSAEAGNETVPLSAQLGHKAGETVQEMSLSSVLTSTMPEFLAPTYSNWNVTTDDFCLISRADHQQSGLTGNEFSNLSTANLRLDTEKAINPSGSYSAINLSPLPNLAERFEGEPITSNICTDNMDVSRGMPDVKRTQKKDSNDPSNVANLGLLEDGGSCVTTSVVGSDFFSRYCASNLHTSLHGDTSLFSHEAINIISAPKLSERFEAEPFTSNICTDNMDISGGISDVKRTQKKNCNDLSQIANLGRVEDGDSCINSSVVGSDFLSRSCGSNMHPIFFHGDFTGFSHEAINLTPLLNVQAHCEAEPVTSNICSGNMDVLEGMTQKMDSNEPSHLANLGPVKDGDSCISQSVVGSNIFSRSCGSNLHHNFLHGNPSGFTHETIKMTSPPRLGDPSGFSYKAINLTSRFEAEPATSNICMDNMDLARGSSNMKKTQKKDSNEPSQIANLGRVEGSDSCISTSVVGSDFPSRSFGPNLHQCSSQLADGALREVSKLSLRDRSCSLKTPMREELLNFRSSSEVQGLFDSRLSLHF